MSFLDRILHIGNGVEALTDWLGQHHAVVSPEHAQSRANRCLECRYNKPKMQMAKPIALAIKRQLEVKNAINLRVEGEKRLENCEICDCFLRLKVWETADRTKPQPGDEYPPWCWVFLEH